MTLRTDVVAADIPLLLSRKSMKTAGINIDLTSDTATIFGKSVMLNMTSSGHYCIPIHKAASITNMEDCSVKNEPDPKEPCKNVVESHLYYADQLKGDNEKLIKSIKMFETAHEAHEDNRGVEHDKLTDSKQFCYKTKEDPLKKNNQNKCLIETFIITEGW